MYTLKSAKFTFIHSFISIEPLGRFEQEPEPSQATGMALAHCILGKFLGVGCHCFPPKFTLTLRRLMSYIYGAPILDVSRSHTTQHSR